MDDIRSIRMERPHIQKEKRNIETYKVVRVDLINHNDPLQFSIVF